jgi:hypothetical protein
VAFEVHALAPDGSEQIVDPGSHTFATGDRFTLYYRPTLPGVVDVFNVNPLGQTTHIDRASIAAGQLTMLGPYEFAANTGDEVLRLELSPCTNETLLAATRAIVRGHGVPGSAVQPGASAMGGAGAVAPSGGSPTLSLPTCGAPPTRGLKPATRDIRKVGAEGTTSYALDPISQQEAATGQLAARSLTIAFHHR